MSLIRRISCPCRNGYYGGRVIAAYLCSPAVARYVIDSCTASTRHPCSCMCACGPLSSPQRDHVLCALQRQLAHNRPFCMRSAATSNLILFARSPVMYEAGRWRHNATTSLCVWSGCYLVHPPGDVVTCPALELCRCCWPMHLKGAIWARDFWIDIKVHSFDYVTSSTLGCQRANAASIMARQITRMSA